VIDRYINRLYISGDDVALALMNAGFELRPDDHSSLKFNAVADALGNLARRKVRRETERFLDCLVDPAPETGRRHNELLETLKNVLVDYRTEGCADPACRQCQRSKAALSRAQATIKNWEVR
jgi:hypothetical protein